MDFLHDKLFRLLKMAITKRPATKKTAPLKDKEAEKFIDSAPDSIKAPEARKGLMRGKREQISHTIPPALLEKVDEQAQLKGLTRAGLINLAISDYLKL